MAYTRLLRAYYRRERAIPDADKYRLSRARTRTQKIAVDTVLDEFFVTQEDGWHNKRADEEIATYQAQADTNRRIANTRRRGRTVHESSTNHTPNQEPRTKNQNQEPEKERSTPVARSDKSPSLADPVNGSAVAYIPLIGEEEWGVTPEFLAELEVAYPQVDGPGTLREIRIWCLANPSKRKTSRGAARFINRWFERVQNNG